MRENNNNIFLKDYNTAELIAGLKIITIKVVDKYLSSLFDAPF